MTQVIRAGYDGVRLVNLTMEAALKGSTTTGLKSQVWRAVSLKQSYSTTHC